MIAAALAIAAALGVYYLYTASVYRWRGLRIGPRAERAARRRSRSLDDWLAQAGLGGLNPAEFIAILCTLAVFGAMIGWALFGAVVPALALCGFAASFPVASYRLARVNRRAAALEAWPRMIEEIRILCGSLGRPIPQALFEVGNRGPEELRPAFAVAHREWLMTTDFGRTIAVLKSQLADPTADVVCETLLVANEVGGSEIESRLASLAEDRYQDLQGRKDARAHQAGARFARRFVLIVPLGMALAGMSVGNGRAAYQTPFGQVLVCVAIGLVVGCWVWAGRIMKLPVEHRVFHEVTP